MKGKTFRSGLKYKRLPWEDDEEPKDNEFIPGGLGLGEEQRDGDSQLIVYMPNSFGAHAVIGKYAAMQPDGCIYYVADKTISTISFTTTRHEDILTAYARVHEIAEAFMKKKEDL